MFLKISRHKKQEKLKMFCKRKHCENVLSFISKSCTKGDAVGRKEAAELTHTKLDSEKVFYAKKDQNLILIYILYYILPVCGGVECFEYYFIEQLRN